MRDNANILGFGFPECLKTPLGYGTVYRSYRCKLYKSCVSKTRLLNDVLCWLIWNLLFFEEAFIYFITFSLVDVIQFYFLFITESIIDMYWLTTSIINSFIDYLFIFDLCTLQSPEMTWHLGFKRLLHALLIMRLIIFVIYYYIKWDTLCFSCACPIFKPFLFFHVL